MFVVINLEDVEIEIEIKNKFQNAIYIYTEFVQLFGIYSVESTSIFSVHLY